MKSLLYNIAPEEVICVSKNIPEIMMNFIKGLTSKPLINNLKNNYKYQELNDLCVKYFGDDFEKWNPLIVNLFANEKEKVYGTDDPVGNYGKSIENLLSIYRKNGMKNVSSKSYSDNRHEILNEADGEKVLSDVFEWIEKNVSL